MPNVNQDRPDQPPRVDGSQELPLLPVKDGAVFPFIITPLTVSRDRAIQAVHAAMQDDTRMVTIVSQKDPDIEEPGPGDLHAVGTVALIMRMLKFPDGRVKVLLQGLARARVTELLEEWPYMRARVSVTPDAESGTSDLAIEALMRTVRRAMEKLAGQGRGINPEVVGVAAGLDSPGQLADLVASNLDLRHQEIQEILEELDPVARLKHVAELATRERQLGDMQKELSDQVQGEMDRSQREYFLRQQLRAIQEELGETGDLSEEIEALKKQADEAGMSEEARTEFDRNLQRLERLHPESAESAIVRNYLEVMAGLPWSRRTEDNLDLAAARSVLDDDHYGLDEIKERIVEYLSVVKLKRDTRGPILCFVGPPGVGKTSLGRSIARALGREFVRISLGGVRDEAEIRGHRRTYVGAMPGRIIQGMQQAGTANPVFMLDEVDKIGQDFRGDPSAALLEVLDPEQNSTFRDHYLGVPFDLSRVLFVATANLLDTIQPAFLDRMEVIRLGGYTLEEKTTIARRHLLPRQLRRHGLDEGGMTLSRAALDKLIEGWTDEAGLRNLERCIARLCRKTARAVAEGSRDRLRINVSNLANYMGPPRARGERTLSRNRVGVSTGLAVTATGGDVLFVEVLAMPGTGQMVLTGKLGDVMKESARAALSYARCTAGQHDVADAAFTSRDFHIHVPEGAIPKDGPSAGVTIATALLSVLTGRPVRREVAMTGEVTLRGTILPVGGIKEKVLAARRVGIRTVLIPEANAEDIVTIPEAARKDLEIVPVSTLEEVYELALMPPTDARTQPTRTEDDEVSPAAVA